MALNKFMGIGNLCQDIELKSTPSGANVVNNSIAINEKYKDKQGNQQESVQFINLVFWNKQAELISTYCRKGSKIFIEGQLQTRKWEDKDGNDRYTTEINVRSLEFLDSKSSSDQQQQPQAQDQSTQPSQQDDFIEDDIPF